MQWTKNDSVERRTPPPTKKNKQRAKWKTSAIQTMTVCECGAARFVRSRIILWVHFLCFGSVMPRHSHAYLPDIYIFFVSSLPASPWKRNGRPVVWGETSSRYCWFSPMRRIYITLLQSTYARLDKIYVWPASVVYSFQNIRNAKRLTFGAVNKTARRTNRSAIRTYEQVCTEIVTPVKMCHVRHSEERRCREREGERERQNERWRTIIIMNGKRLNAMETILPLGNCTEWTSGTGPARSNVATYSMYMWIIFIAN